jgi:hypothetical protein
MADDLSGLYSRLLMAISSRPAQKIDFYVVSWPINAGAFARVYSEIVKHMFWSRSGIEVRVAEPGEMPAGAGALYKYVEDTYVFSRESYGTTVLQQATMVHESVHAWIDLQGFAQGYFGAASDADNEAAAYITESLFCYYATGRGCLELQDASRLTWDVKTVRAVADRIALSIKDTTKAIVSEKDRRAMVDAVTASPVYQKNNTTRQARLRANGISQRDRPEDYPVRRH